MAPAKASQLRSNRYGGFMDRWQNPPQNGSAASLVWLISFGDLLTLLVCFFLVLTPWNSLRARTDAKNALIPVGSDRQASNGTPLANSSVGPKPGVIIELPIERGQLADATRNAAFTVTLRDVLTSPEAIHASVLLRVCGGDRREEIIRSVGSTLLKHKRSTQTISIELLGECETFEVLYPTSAAVAGSVRIVRE